MKRRTGTWTNTQGGYCAHTLYVLLQHMSLIYLNGDCYYQIFQTIKVSLGSNNFNNNFHQWNYSCNFAQN